MISPEQYIHSDPPCDNDDAKGIALAADQSLECWERKYLSSSNIPSIHPVGATSYKAVTCADALEWLGSMPDNALPTGSCGFTSIPDISELATVFHKYAIRDYKAWFIDTAELFMRKLPYGSCAIFLQSDIRFMHDHDDEVLEWVDKSFLCTTAAERVGCKLLWHKIVSFFARADYPPMPHSLSL